MIYSVGHGDLATHAFLELLSKFDIDLVIDVRSVPQSKQAPQFDRSDIKRSLNRAGFMYIWKGKTLGGRYPVPEEEFSQAIKSVLDIPEARRVVLMCAEGDFAKCHRFTKLAERFKRCGKAVHHIRHDGTAFRDRAIQRGLFE